MNQASGQFLVPVLVKKRYNLTRKTKMSRRLTVTTIETTKMSSKGQIVIPEGIRNKLGLKPGDKFLVMGDKDVLILKMLSVPRLDEFEGLLKEARRRATAAGMKRADVARVVSEARSRR
ncbi:MAG: AbrB/MazE/SpoVT family DNA-binding domain-containing protein [Chloroflexi bacterium]|nr:AbrB/MazE/SpoVT family DNA-binding domain-containing protein [Chloroflexota bacterium]